jgi:hypothetical protein
VSSKHIVALAALLSTLLAACSPTKSSGARGANNTAKPPPRQSAAAAWDEARGQLVLFGGATPTADNRSALDDTWTWDATAGWIQHRTRLAPPRRFGAAMAYDPETRTVVLAAGSPQNFALDDTWLWNGSSWRPGADSLPGPKLIDDSATMAWDPAHHQLVLVVCCGNNGAGEAVLTFTGDGVTWTQRDTVHIVDSRTDMHAAFDPQTGTVVLLDADDPNRTEPPSMWSWDGADWTRLATPVPTGTPRRTRADQPGSLLAMSPAEGRLLDVVENAGGHGAAWVDNSGTWESAAGSGTPPRISAVVTDVRDGRVLVVGGPGAAHDTDTVLQRTDAGWTRPSPPLRAARPWPPFPMPAQAPPMVVHPAKAYVPPPQQFGDYVPDDRSTPGPVGDFRLGPGSTDSWEVFDFGPGEQLISVAVAVYSTSLAAHAFVTQLPSQLTGTSEPVALTPPALGEDAEMYSEPFTLDNGLRTILVHIAWREGRVAFVYVLRDVASANPDNAVPGARLADRRALQLAKG